MTDDGESELSDETIYDDDGADPEIPNDPYVQDVSGGNGGVNSGYQPVDEPMPMFPIIVVPSTITTISVPLSISVSPFLVMISGTL